VGAGLGVAMLPRLAVEPVRPRHARVLTLRSAAGQPISKNDGRVGRVLRPDDHPAAVG
jgi:hypothetical protein